MTWLLSLPLYSCCSSGTAAQHQQHQADSTHAGTGIVCNALYNTSCTHCQAASLYIVCMTAAVSMPQTMLVQETCGEHEALHRMKTVLRHVCSAHWCLTNRCAPAVGACASDSWVVWLGSEVWLVAHRSAHTHCGAIIHVGALQPTISTCRQNRRVSNMAHCWCQKPVIRVTLDSPAQLATSTSSQHGGWQGLEVQEIWTEKWTLAASHTVDRQCCSRAGCLLGVCSLRARHACSASPGGVSQVGGWKQEPPAEAGSTCCGSCAAALAAAHSSSTASSFMWSRLVSAAAAAAAAAAETAVHTHTGKVGACYVMG
jgi:hypothetical protein